MSKTARYVAQLRAQVIGLVCLFIDSYKSGDKVTSQDTYNILTKLGFKVPFSEELDSSYIERFIEENEDGVFWSKNMCIELNSVYQ